MQSKFSKIIYSLYSDWIFRVVCKLDLKTHGDLNWNMKIGIPDFQKSSANMEFANFYFFGSSLEAIKSRC